MISRFFGLLIFLPTLFALVNIEELYSGGIRQMEYDYIIVGAGSTGSVLANRLSEDESSSVLLLEAGGTPTDVSEIPLFQSQLINSDLDWGYTIEPQTKAFFGTKGHLTTFPRGKVLGGSSTINCMIYVRGNHRDYDLWQEQGATGWSWENVFYYFTKSEDQRDHRYLYNGFHKSGGYLTVSSNSYATPLHGAYLEATRELGMQYIDINGATQLGISNISSTIRDGLRCSTEKAFLRPAAHRPNLDIVTFAQVTKIQFDGNERARWVHFEHLNGSRSLAARKEIILSAGAIGSPQILMLSGVGPKEHLQELGIPVIADLPVGQNLQDHVLYGGHVFLLNSSVGLVFPRDVDEKAIGALLRGEGPLGVPAYLESTAFGNTKFQPVSDYNWPDVQFFLVASTTLSITNNEWMELIEKYIGKDITTLFSIILRPKSRGFLKLRSKNPLDHPIIDPKYLSDDEDLHRLIDGMKIAEKMIHSRSLQKFGPIQIPEVIKVCEGIDKETDDFFACLARTWASSGLHISGTCKMGDPWNPTTVVDPELRVKGVKGLRVADASVMPTITSGNTNAPCIMIGEKAADMIRGRIWDPKKEKVVHK